MNRAAKKRRAKRRSQQYANERVLDALLLGPRLDTAVLRHGDTWTFYNKDGKPSSSGSLRPADWPDPLHKEKS